MALIPSLLVRQVLVLFVSLFLSHNSLRAAVLDNSTSTVSLPALPHNNPKIRIEISATATTASYIIRAASMYELLRPDVEFVITNFANTATQLGSQALFQSLVAGDAEFGFSTLIPTAAQKASAPDLMHWPAGGFAFGPVYNLPMVDANLVFSLPVLGQIYTGQINTWSDARIQALNPGVKLPSVGIEIALLDESAPYLTYFTRSLRATDPLFKSLISESSSPTWPVHNYYKYQLVSQPDGTASYIASHPYAFGLTLLMYAEAMKLREPLMVNAHGNVVAPAVTSIYTAFSSLAVQTTLDTTSTIQPSQNDNLVGARGTNAWPLVVQGTFHLTRSYYRTTCVSRTELIKFLLWIFSTDAAMYTLTDGMYLTMLTAEMDANIGLRDTLMNSVQCDELKVNAGTSDSSSKLGYALLSSTHANVRKLLVEQYGADDLLASFEMVFMDELQQLQNMLFGPAQIDASWIFPMAFRKMYPGYLESFVSTQSLSFFPSEIRAVVPIHHLHPTLLAYMQAANALPLKIDMETYAKLFTAEVTSWDDPLILHLNPVLADALNANPSIDPDIKLVFFGRGNIADAPSSSLTNHLLIALNQTSTFKKANISWSLPADLRPLAQRLDAQFVTYDFVKSETAMESQVSYWPNAIGYKLAASNVTDDLTDFAIVRYYYDAFGQKQSITIQATPDAFKRCADAAATPADNQLAFVDIEAVLADPSEYAAYCYPFPILNTFVVETDVETKTNTLAATTDTTSNGTTTTNSVTNIRSSLEINSLCFFHKGVVTFLKWLNFDPWVNSPTQILGRQPFIFSDKFDSAFELGLRDLKCGGEPILYSPTIYWSLSMPVEDFVISLATIGLFCSCISILLIVRNRYRMIVRSADWIMQGCSFFGVPLLFISNLLFVQNATTPICTGLSVTLTFGLTLTLAPQTLKIYRIYHTFVRKKYKIKTKFGSLKSYITLLILLVIDIALLIVASAVGNGALSPISTDILQSNRIHSYTTCAPTSASIPITAVLFGIKGLLLGVGAFAGFRVRSVASAFGESTKISWSLWGSTVSAIIILPLIALTGGAYNDIYVFLVSLLILWIALSTVGFEFGYKVMSFVTDYWIQYKVTQRDLSKSSRYAVSGGGYSKQDGSHLTSANGSFLDTLSGTNTGSNADSYKWISGSGSRTYTSYQFPVLDGINLHQLERYIYALESQLVKARQAREKGPKGNREREVVSQNPRSGSHLSSHYEDDASISRSGLVKSSRVAQPSQRMASKGLTDLTSLELERSQSPTSANSVQRAASPSNNFNFNGPVRGTAAAPVRGHARARSFDTKQFKLVRTSSDAQGDMTTPRRSPSFGPQSTVNHIVTPGAISLVGSPSASSYALTPVPPSSVSLGTGIMSIPNILNATVTAVSDPEATGVPRTSARSRPSLSNPRPTHTKRRPSLNIKARIGNANENPSVSPLPSPQNKAAAAAAAANIANIVNAAHAASAASATSESKHDS